MGTSWPDRALRYIAAAGHEDLQNHKGNNDDAIGNKIAAGGLVQPIFFIAATSHFLSDLLAQQARRLHQQHNDQTRQTQWRR